MADELDYEAMLSELQGLLGRHVFVVLEVHDDRGKRPLGAIRGNLVVAEAGDLDEIGNYPDGEYVAFFVGDEKAFGVPKSFLFVSPLDFKRGQRESGILSFENGRARTSIVPI